MERSWRQRNNNCRKRRSEICQPYCKHLKSNAIALVKNKQLIGKGCGQTSRIDSLRQSIEKAKQFKFGLHGAVLASDAFFPFNDCVKNESCGRDRSIHSARRLYP
jgi:phosphoribosylaminoimidazolecarboxamide formyltransferase/IMP cyclohydrolase